METLRPLHPRCAQVTAAGFLQTVVPMVSLSNYYNYIDLPVEYKGRVYVVTIMRSHLPSSSMMSMVAEPMMTFTLSVEEVADKVKFSVFSKAELSVMVTLSHT